MATRLKLVFSGAGEKKALMQGIVADGSIYEDVPKGIVGAEFLDSTSTPISLG